MPDTPARGIDRVALAVATCGGIGRLRPASGTWATAAALALAAGLWAMDLRGPWVMAGVMVVASVACVLASPAAIRATGQLDPSLVVIDEVAGTFAALAVLPAGVTAEAPWTTLAVAGLLFRILDIGKPWPLLALEHLPGGYGILLDDLAGGFLAGMLTLAVLH